MVGRPSIEAMAMSGADWARYSATAADYADEGAPPPEHLRAFEAFLETVVPADMALAFTRGEAAARGGRRRSHREDVEEKLKLWAKAVAREAKVAMLGSSHAREPVVLARLPGEPNSLARGGEEKGAETSSITSPTQARVGKLGLHAANTVLPPSRPCSG